MVEKGSASKKEAVKRPMSSWHFFFKEECELRKKEQNKITEEVRREIGQKWKSLSKERKDEFVRKAKLSSNEYAESKVGLPPKPAKARIETRCTPERVHKMVEQLKPFQRELVNEIGFGSLLHLKCIHLQRDLCGWLVDRFDPETKILELYGNNIPISPMDVEYIMGLNAHGIDVPTERSNEEINEICQHYGLGNGKITMTVLMEQLTSTHLSGNEFKVKFILFVLGALLCPTMELAPKRSFLHAFRDVDRIKNMNWAKFVFEFFVDGIRKFKSKQQKSINGCLLFLMVFYLERTSVGGYNAPLTSRHCPRLEAWGDKDVNNRMQMLKKLGGYQIHNDKIKVMVVADDFSASASQLRQEEHCDQPPLSRPYMEEHKENKGYEDRLCKVERALEDVKSDLAQGFAALKEKNLEHKNFEERLCVVESDFKTLRSDILTDFATFKKDIMDQIQKGFIEREKGKGKISSEWEPKQKFHEASPSQHQHQDNDFFDEIGENQQLEPIKAITISESQPNLTLPAPRPQKKSKPCKEKSAKKKKVREALSSTGASPNPIVQTRSYELRQPSRYVRSPYQSHNLNKGKDLANAVDVRLKASGRTQSTHTRVMSQYQERDLTVLHAYIFDSTLNQSEILSSTDLYFANRHAFLSLQPKQWISSEIINLVVYKLTLEQQGMIPKMSEWFLPTHFSQEILSGNARLIKAHKAYKRNNRYISDLSACNKIFIPINDNEEHWYLCVIDMRSRIIQIWDSLPSPSRKHEREAQVKLVMGLWIICHILHASEEIGILY